jgi:hypothetical protein
VRIHQFVQGKLADLDDQEYEFNWPIYNLHPPLRDFFEKLVSLEDLITVQPTEDVLSML